MRTFVPQIHEKFKPFLEHGPRYKGAKGGRGGSKSYALADCALARMIEEPIEIAICREYHSTIADSVHKLIRSRIEAHGLSDLFEITGNRVVYKPNGSHIIYKHLHNNVTDIKGLEGANICWIFEAEQLQKESFDVLDPTIRSDTGIGGHEPEIWIEWNPKYEDDFVWQFMVVNPPSNSVLITINYPENPWCPQSLIEMAEERRRRDPDGYRNIWLGEPCNTGELVYPTFDKAVHVRDFRIDEMVPSCNFFMGQDPHTHYYPFCVWVARVAKGDDEFDYVVYNEWPTLSTFRGKKYHEMRMEKKCTLTLKQRAGIYKTLDNTLDRTIHDISILARGIDTRFAKGSGGYSTTLMTRGIITEMADPENGGLMFETPPEATIDVQRDKIRKLLEYDTQMKIHAFNDAHLFVMPHCHNVIDALEFHRFDKSGKEREDEKRKDALDALKIALAIASQYDHRKESVHKESAMVPVQDNVSELQRLYMRGTSLTAAHRGRMN